MSSLAWASDGYFLTIRTVLQKVIRDLEKKVSSDYRLGAEMLEQDGGYNVSRIDALRQRYNVALSYWRSWLHDSFQLYGDRVTGDIIWKDNKPPAISPPLPPITMLTFPPGKHICSPGTGVSPAEVYALCALRGS